MKFLPSPYSITIENCISKNIESFAMKVPSFQGIFRTSWKRGSNKNQLFQGTFSRFLQLFQGTFHWFLQFFQGTFEFFTSTLFWFKQTNSRNQGGIPPWFLEFNVIKKVSWAFHTILFMNQVNKAFPFHIFAVNGTFMKWNFLFLSQYLFLPASFSANRAFHISCPSPMHRQNDLTVGRHIAMMAARAFIVSGFLFNANRDKADQ